MVGEDVGSTDTPVGAAPVERDAAGFGPGDQGRSGHAEQHGSLAGREVLVSFQRSVRVSVDEVSEDRVDQLGCGR